MCIFFSFFLFSFDFSKPRRCLCSSAVENFAFQKQRTLSFFFFSSVCSSLGASSSTCRESGPTAPAALLSVSKLWKTVWFRQSLSGSLKQRRAAAVNQSGCSSSERLPVQRRRPHLPGTHSSTLRPLFCSVASWSRSNQTDEQSCTRCTTTKTHHTVKLKSDSSSNISQLVPSDFLGFKKNLSDLLYKKKIF